jgi:hypothetical protein
MNLRLDHRRRQTGGETSRKYVRTRAGSSPVGARQLRAQPNQRSSDEPGLWVGGGP